MDDASLFKELENNDAKICLICRRLLELEEEMIQTMCSEIIRVKPDVVVTEKGVSDLAQHFLVKAGISVIRRVRKTDNNRIARLETYHPHCHVQLILSFISICI